MPRERSFKNYIADRFYNELYDGIQAFIKDYHRDLDLTLYRVHDIDLLTSRLFLWMYMTKQVLAYRLMSQ